MLSPALLGDFLIAKDQVQEWPLPLARLEWAPCGGSPSGDQAAAALPRAPSVASSMGPCPTELWGSRADPAGLVPVLAGGGQAGGQHALNRVPDGRPAPCAASASQPSLAPVVYR